MMRNRWRMAGWTAAGLAFWLAVGAAGGAERHFPRDGNRDYLHVRLWKEDGAVKCSFMGAEMGFGEVVGKYRALAERGATDLAVHWWFSEEVTMGEAAGKIGELVALGFTNQFFTVEEALEGGTLVFDLEDVWGNVEEVVEVREWYDDGRPAAPQ